MNKEDHEIPRLRGISSCSQTTSSTLSSTTTDRYSSHGEGNVEKLVKIPPRTSSILEEEFNTGITSSSDDSRDTNHNDSFILPVHDDDDQEKEKLIKYNESFSIPANEEVKSYENDNDNYTKSISHEPPSTILSSPARSWKRIGFHWCQPSDSITTCCTTSKIVNTDEGEEPKREPETPERPKGKLYESSSCATTPIHMLHNAKRSNTKNEMKQNINTYPENLDDNTYATTTTLSNTVTSFFFQIKDRLRIWWMGWKPKPLYCIITTRRR